MHGNHKRLPTLDPPQGPKRIDPGRRRLCTERVRVRSHTVCIEHLNGPLRGRRAKDGPHLHGLGVDVRQTVARPDHGVQYPVHVEPDGKFLLKPTAPDREALPVDAANNWVGLHPGDLRGRPVLRNKQIERAKNDQSRHETSGRPPKHYGDEPVHAGMRRSLRALTEVLACRRLLLSQEAAPACKTVCPAATLRPVGPGRLGRCDGCASPTGVSGKTSVLYGI